MANLNNFSRLWGNRTVAIVIIGSGVIRAGRWWSECESPAKRGWGVGSGLVDLSVKVVLLSELFAVSRN